MRRRRLPFQRYHDVKRRGPEEMGGEEELEGEGGKGAAGLKSSLCPFFFHNLIPYLLLHLVLPLD